MVSLPVGELQLPLPLTISGQANYTARIIHVFRLPENDQVCAVAGTAPPHYDILHAVVTAPWSSLPTFALTGTIFEVQQITGIPVAQRDEALHRGTIIIHLQRSSDICAGGHHLASGATPAQCWGGLPGKDRVYVRHSRVDCRRRGLEHRVESYVHPRSCPLHCPCLLEPTWKGRGAYPVSIRRDHALQQHDKRPLCARRRPLGCHRDLQI